jgi:thiamine-monophosphate kinase
VVRSAQTKRWIDGLYRGIEKAARTYGFHVVGGELARTEGPAMISVALTGEVPTADFVGRAGGRARDVLFVTGVLGRSFASGWHLRFSPRIEQARWLVRHFRPRAMMDLSDGLAADLPRLAAAGGTGFIVNSALVPRRRGASLQQALGDGEDFELLFAIDPRKAARLEVAWKKKFPRVPLTRIGQLAAPGVARGLCAVRGYDHFAR